MRKSPSILLLSLLTLGVSLCGCSTWRCRGFISSVNAPAAAPRQAYVLERLEFRDLAADNLERRDRSPMQGWLSEQDGLIGTSYLEDIAKESGLTNDAPGAVKVIVSVVPIQETKTGKVSIAWPLCATLGVFPCHFVEEVPFDVIVRFDSAVKDRPDLPHHSFATAIVGHIRVDRQYGLTRMDMDAPPPARSAVGEIRDDGTVGTGSELRMERFRQIFVKTVASAVLDSIATRENAERVRIDSPATEFGQVVFAVPDPEERQKTAGWGQKPDVPVVPPESLETFLERAWNRPRSEAEVVLKRAVESGLTSKEEWRRQMSDVWRRENSNGGRK